LFIFILFTFVKEEIFMSKQDAIVVFTARSPEHIIREGGSGAWILNAARAKRCTWLVCTQNRNNPDYEFSDATEPHGSAFLLGKVSGVRRSEEDKRDDRWLIIISEYTRINVPDAWDHGRNPVRYTSLEELGISLDGIEFQPVPETGTASSPVAMKLAESGVPMLTITEAKKALATTYGIKPEAIEITIRG
jgi:hypothetical protein